MAKPRGGGDQRLSASIAGRSLASGSRRGLRAPLARGLLAPSPSRQLPLPFQAWAEQRKSHTRPARPSPGARNGFAAPSHHVRRVPRDGALSQSLLLPPLPSGRHSAPCVWGGQLLLLGEGLGRRGTGPPHTARVPQEPRRDRASEAEEDPDCLSSRERPPQLDPETEQRILDWLEEVNHCLFSTVSCSVKQEAEADTSIKIIYQGD